MTSNQMTPNSFWQLCPFTVNLNHLFANLMLTESKAAPCCPCCHVTCDIVLFSKVFRGSTGTLFWNIVIWNHIASSQRISERFVLFLNIEVTSYKRHGILNHRQLDGFLKLTTRKNYVLQRISNWESVSMSWRHRVWHATMRWDRCRNHVA